MASGAAAGAAGPVRCPQCKRAPVNKKEAMCALCLSKAYCSLACLEAGKKHHRRECPRLGFTYFMGRLAPALRACAAMVKQNRSAEAEEYMARLIKVGENALKHRGEPDKAADLAHGLGELILQAAETATHQGSYELAESRIHQALALRESTRMEAWMRLHLRFMATYHLGDLRTAQFHPAGGEALLRKALELGEELLHFVTGSCDYVTAKMDQVAMRLASALTLQKNYAEIQLLHHKWMLPNYVRRLLGVPRASQAHLDAFDVAAALQVPLDSQTARILELWAGGMIVTGRYTLRDMLPVRLRALEPLVELEGPSARTMTSVTRSLILDCGDMLELSHLLSLYSQQAGMPWTPQEAANTRDPSSVSATVAHRLEKEARATGSADLLDKAIEFYARAASEARALGPAHPNQVMRLGEYGQALMVHRADMQAAQALFEEALEMIQPVHGEEQLLQMGMSSYNVDWLKSYVQLLQSKTDAEQSEEARALARWLHLLQEQLEGKEQAVTEEILEEIRAAMGMGGGTAGVAGTESEQENAGQGLSRRARQRLDARRRASEARRVKRERARAREEPEQGAATTETPRIGREESEADEEAAAVACGEGLEEDEEDSEEEETAVEECRICLFEFAGEEGEEGREVLACAHAYHAKCLDAWRERCKAKKIRALCPYCRHPM